MNSEADTAQARKPEEANFRWNFAVNMMDISFYMLGMNLVSTSTILPLLVSRLTPSKIAVGLVPTLFSLGFLLPQLFTASYAEGLRRKKPFIMWVSGFGERLPWLFIGLAVALFANSSPALTLGLMYFFLLAASTSAGVTTPAWYDLIAKAIPLQYRGLWAGVSFGLGAFMGIAGSALAGTILTEWAFPTNYALCFVLAFIALMFSYWGLSLNREADSPVVKPQTSLWSYFKRLPRLLRRDRNYLAFLISRSVANLGGMASGFFIVYGAERFGVSGAQAGALTATLVGSQTVMNLLWGVLGDRKGHKLVLAGSTFAMALAALAALLIPSPLVLWVIFFMVGAVGAGDNVSGLNIILEFCAPEDRPTYIGLTNTLLAPFRSFAPLIGGWLATWLGYPPLFLVAFLFSLLGGSLLSWWLREPRHEDNTAPLDPGVALASE